MACCGSDALTSAVFTLLLAPKAAASAFAGLFLAFAFDIFGLSRYDGSESSCSHEFKLSISTPERSETILNGQSVDLRRVL